MGSDPLPVSLLNRMTVLDQTYETYRFLDSKVQAGSPLIRLSEMRSEKQISDEDYEFIKDLIDRGIYKKR